MTLLPSASGGRLLLASFLSEIADRSPLADDLREKVGLGLIIKRFLTLQMMKNLCRIEGVDEKAGHDLTHYGLSINIMNDCFHRNPPQEN